MCMAKKYKGLIKGIFLSVIPWMADAEKPKNILFIAIDDLRTALGCYGDTLSITPYMDELAQKGFVFERAYCQQAVSGPSRASFLTGLRPEQTGVTDLSGHFREKCPNIVTLPQYFKEAGYQSICIGKIFHGSARTQDSISWSIPERHHLSIKKNEYLLPENQHGGKAAASEVADVPLNRFEDGKITEEAIAELKRFGRSKEPFFLAVGFKKPHLPFGTPKRFWDMHREKFESLDLSGMKHSYKNIPAIALHHSEELRGYSDIPDKGDLPETKVRELLNAYYACTTFVDHLIGNLLNELKKQELDKNTIVVIVSDHGFHLGEQDLWCKSTNFEIAAKVPLLIYDPAYGNYATHIKSNVELIDIHPTLLDLCGFGKKPELAGQSLVPVMKGESQGKNIAFSLFPRPYHAIHNADRQTHMGYTVRTQDWRFTLWVEVATGKITDRELYYLPGDALEKENLSGHPLYKDMEEELSDHFQNAKLFSQNLRSQSSN